MNSREIQRQLALHFDYIRNTVIPNCFISDYEMDFAIITRAGFLIECEIKISLADFNADKAKEKWKRLKCKQLYYCVPISLVDKILPKLSPEYGLLRVDLNAKWPEKKIIVVKRASCIKGAKKLSEESIIYLTRKMSYRYWDEARVYSLRPEYNEHGLGGGGGI